MANGFEWAYNLNGGDGPLIKTFVMADTETLTRGDMISIEAGLADLTISGNTVLAGAFVGPENPSDAKDGEPGVVEGTTAVTVIKVIVNPDAGYAVIDDNARLAGATLDVDGSTGAMGFTGTSNVEFVVVERKRQNSDPTLVMIASTAHYLASV